MYFLSDLCCICLCKDKKLDEMSAMDINGKSYRTKLSLCLRGLMFSEENPCQYLCEECGIDVDFVYRFYEKCKTSEFRLNTYKALLTTIGKTPANISVRLKDFAKGTIKREGLNLAEETVEEESLTHFADERFLSVISANNPTCLPNKFVNFNDARLDTEYVKNNSDSKLHTSKDDHVRGFVSNELETEAVEFSAEEIKVEIPHLEIDTTTREDLDHLQDPLMDLNHIKVDMETVEDTQSLDGFEPRFGPLYETPVQDSDMINLLEFEARNAHKCVSCTTSFSSKAALNRHICGPGEAVCTVCGKSFTEKSFLLLHMNVHVREEKKFICDTCGKVFKRKFCLESHTRVHTDEKPFECDECGKWFRNRTNLQRHSRMHTGAKPFGCSDCGHQFRNQSNLIRHKLLHSNETPFGCTYCEETFRNKGDLRKHFVTHTTLKPNQVDVSCECDSEPSKVPEPFECSVCSKKFSKAVSLEVHTMIHTAEKPHTCETCGNKFTSKKSLYRHRKLHAGIRHQCRMCHKNFSQSCHLNAHMLIHTGSKPYNCEVCGMKFRQKSNLGAHMRGHTGDKPYVCDICGVKFAFRYRLKRHVAQHENDNLINNETDEVQG